MDSPEVGRLRGLFLIGGAVVIAVVGLFLIWLLSRGESLPAAVDYERPEELTAALFADPDVVENVVAESLSADEAVSLVESLDGEGAEVVFSTGEGNLGDQRQSTEPNVDRGDAHDVTTVAVSVDVPSDATCMVIPRLRFGSDENSNVPDGFVIEVGESTWSLDTSSDSEAQVAMDTSSGLVPEEFPVGTYTVDGSTPELEARVEIDPGQNNVFFSVYDAENAEGTSVAVVGGIRFEENAECGNQIRLADRSNLVALGDSYASGFGLPPFESGTDEIEGNNCQRSTLSYPEVLAELGDFELESRACQGARTQDLYNEFAAREEEPQLEGVQPDTGVVVLTIGGNDTAWADVLTSCVLESLLGPACNQNTQANTQFDETLNRLAGETGEPAEIRPFEEILADIGDRAPFADIVVVSYPPLFTEGGSGLSNSERCAGVLKSDQEWINQQLAEATGLMTEAAITVDAVVVDLAGPRGDSRSSSTDVGATRNLK